MISMSVARSSLVFIFSAKHSRATGIGVGSINNQFAFQSKTLLPQGVRKTQLEYQQKNLLTVTSPNTEVNSWGNTYRFDYETHKMGAFSNRQQTKKFNPLPP